MPRPPMKRKKTSARPIPGKSAAQSGNQIKDGEDAQAVAAPEAVARDTGQHGAENGADERAGYRDAQQVGERW